MKQFITREEWEQLSRSTNEVMFNEILNRLYNMTIEAAMLQLPTTMEVVAKNTMAQMAVTKKFYDDNPSFIPNKSIVIEVVQSTEEANPGMKYEDILALAKTEIDRRISNLSLGNQLPLHLMSREEVNLQLNGEL